MLIDSCEKFRCSLMIVFCCRCKRIHGRQWKMCCRVMPTKHLPSQHPATRLQKEVTATTEIWKNVDMIWAAANEVTERQLSACVTKRLNAQRYARQVLRAEEFITFCSNKRNQVNPTRQRLIEFYNKNSWNTEEDLKKVCNSRTLKINQLLHCFKRLLE